MKTEISPKVEVTQHPKHILVIRLSAMGDVAMTVPVIRAFTQQHPDVRITILTREYFTPFFRDLPNVSVFLAEVNGKHNGVLGLYKLSRELKELGIDAIADLHNVLRSKILKFFLFGKLSIQIDKGRNEKKSLVSGHVFKQLKTTHQRYVDIFEALGYPLNISNPTFPKPKQLHSKYQNILGDKTSNWIGIAPFAAHEGKMYPLDFMKSVIETLSKNYQVILFGGGDKEITILNEIESTIKNVVNIAGKFSLDEEMNIISNLDVMLSMDSGNAHVAAMLGIKVITIWGVTHPFAGFAPFNQPEDYALLSNRNQFPEIPTSIYGNKFPENYKEASRSVSPEVVIEKVKSIL